jgi:hypothetical protein
MIQAATVTPADTTKFAQEPVVLTPHIDPRPADPPGQAGATFTPPGE